MKCFIIYMVREMVNKSSFPIFPGPQIDNSSSAHDFGYLLFVHTQLVYSLLLIVACWKGNSNMDMQKGFAEYTGESFFESESSSATEHAPKG